MVSTTNVDMKKLFPRKRTQTTVDRHKANTNKDKSEKSEKKIWLRKRAMIRKCGDLLSQFGLHFEPVVIGRPSLSKETTPAVTREKEIKTPAKKVKIRPLMREKAGAASLTGTTSGTKSSGLQIRTITPLTKTSTGKRRRRSRP